VDFETLKRSVDAFFAVGQPEPVEPRILHHSQANSPCVGANCSSCYDGWRQIALSPSIPRWLLSTLARFPRALSFIADGLFLMSVTYLLWDA